MLLGAVLLARARKGLSDYCYCRLIHRLIIMRSFAVVMLGLGLLSVAQVRKNCIRSLRRSSQPIIAQLASF